MTVLKIAIFLFQYSNSYAYTKPVKYGLPSFMKARTSRTVTPRLITTVYDDPQQIDPKEPLLVRDEPTTLKHRQYCGDSFVHKSN